MSQTDETNNRPAAPRLARFLHSPLFRRFWAIAGAASVRVKVLGIVVGVVLLLGIFVIAQMNSVLTNTLLAELAVQGHSLSEHIAEEAAALLQTDDPQMLSFLLHEQQTHYSSDTHNTHVLYITLYAADGTLLASVGEIDPLADLAPYQIRPTVGNPLAQNPTAPIDMAINAEVVEFRSALPQNLGTVRLGLAFSPIRQTVNRVLLQLIATTLVMVAVGFGAAFFLTWILTRPVLELVAATTAVARGDLSQRVARWANDEIGELATAFNTMTASLQQAEQERKEREQLREQYVNGIIMAQENERRRIARELHDGTSQSLTSLLVGLQNLKSAQDGEELESRIQELRAIVGQTLDEVRTISWRLRPSALDDLGLVSALQHYIEDYQARYAIPVDFVARGFDPEWQAGEAKGHSRLPGEIETTIYRIVQEALTNVARYAQAQHVSIVLHRRSDLIRIIIEDDGSGFDPESTLRQKKSLGLQGMRERASLFNGTFTVESAPGQGTTLVVEIPYAGES